MKSYENKLENWIKDNNIKCEHLSFEESCHSVEEAAQSANVSKEHFVKNICMVSEDKLIVCIIKGEDMASTGRVSKFLNIDRPIIATPEEILRFSGYPCGGTPSFGYNAIFLIDEKVMEKQTVYTGGGSPSSLVKISPAEMQKANNGKVCRIRK